jgi:N-acetylglucosaminyldiphosphoundecaprenol N-acetyl-beta-D-mannosaminyltransferase
LKAVTSKVEKQGLQMAQFRLLGTSIAGTNLPSAIRKVISWLQDGAKGKMVTFTNVHMLVEGLKNPGFARLLQKSDLNCPDGMPLVWYGRKKTGGDVERVCGPDFMPEFCAATAEMHLRHFFYGGDPGVAEKAAEKLQRRYPGMCIAGVYSPPFRALTTDEDAEVVRSINAAQPDVVWVCLGCPTQEIWIHEHRDKLNVPVLLAVGQALDIVAGTKSRAPRIMRIAGLEWAFRLYQEPRRLWKRYMVGNSIFLIRLLLETRLETRQPSRRSETKA